MCNFRYTAPMREEWVRLPFKVTSLFKKLITNKAVSPGQQPSASTHHHESPSSTLRGWLVFQKVNSFVHRSGTHARAGRLPHTRADTLLKGYVCYYVKQLFPALGGGGVMRGLYESVNVWHWPNGQPLSAQAKLISTQLHVELKPHLTQYLKRDVTRP